MYVYGHRGVAPMTLGATGAGTVTFVEGGKWVDLTAKAMNVYKNKRGFRAGVRVTLPGGAVGKIVTVPATTCGDIAAAFDGWAGGLIKDVGFTNKYGLALWQLQIGQASVCPTPQAEYAQNQMFWNLVRRAAIEMDSRKAIPPRWELFMESVSESWDEFTDASGKALKGAASAIGGGLWWALKPLVVPAALVAVVYFGVIKPRMRG